MRDLALRQYKDRWLQPIADQPLFAGIHPNLVSLAALLVGLSAAGAVVVHAYWLGLALWIANRVLDGLDGVVARLYAKQSDFGGYLDLFFDFIIYLAIPMAFVVAAPTPAALWGLAALLASYYLNTMSWLGLAALLEKRNASTATRQTTLEMPAGLIEGAETILLYALFYMRPQQINLLFFVMAVLVLFTALQRLIWVWRFVR
ncbi:MAG: CDP-alcohol phosphatidyltransferase family protein [Caldilineaceae bacterium]|nr:CDP-alcohol phosphatidyltransferase family protein [Caldilineaceae bacterium]